MHNFFYTFGALGLTFLTLFSGGHKNVDSHNNSHQIVHEGHHENNQIITARGSVSRFGQTVNFTFTFPEKGGKINGAVSGACTGSIHGVYLGNNLIGQASGTCPILLISVNGTATFNGHVEEDQTSTTLHATVTAQGQSENIEIPVTLSK